MSKQPSSTPHTTDRHRSRRKGSEGTQPPIRQEGDALVIRSLPLAAYLVTQGIEPSIRKITGVRRPAAEYVVPDSPEARRAWWDWRHWAGTAAATDYFSACAGLRQATAMTV